LSCIWSQEVNDHAEEALSLFAISEVSKHNLIEHHKANDAKKSAQGFILSDPALLEQEVEHIHLRLCPGSTD
jgi:hypothetical protein